MNNSGYVYILINQSLPNCVKIGKTKRDTATRAAELSAATGVPTPFFVAYEAFFNDCDYAESYIHALLESSGARLSSNREFFTISASEAINVVVRAQSKIESSSNSGEDDSPMFSDELLLDLDVTVDSVVEEPWADILEEAESYRYGYEDELENPKKAIELFKLAAKLGSADAYIQLGEMHSDLYGATKGIDWIKSGADKGLPECWAELARVFSGLNMYFDESCYSIENAIKCYRRFFKIVNLNSFDSEGHTTYAYMKRFIEILGARWSDQDKDSVKEFLDKFKKHILDNSDNIEERSAKLSQLDQLMVRA